jgi:hypothetical protein
VRRVEVVRVVRWFAGEAVLAVIRDVDMWDVDMRDVEAWEGGGVGRGRAPVIMGALVRWLSKLTVRVVVACVGACVGAMLGVLDVGWNGALLVVREVGCDDASPGALVVVLEEACDGALLVAFDCVMVVVMIGALKVAFELVLIVVLDPA